MRVGLDIGGTKTDAVVLDPAGIVRERVRVPTGKGPGAVLDAAERAVREAVARASASEVHGGDDDGDLGVTSIGVGIPGMVDPATGRVRHAVNLDVEDLALAELLAQRVGVPVRVQNDVKAAALGAYHLLGLTGPATLLNLGTGLAAAAVIDGRLWRGATGGSGEIGHIPLYPDGALCPCGQRGCLETVASGSGIARMWPPGAQARRVPAIELFDAADAGDERALEVRTAFAQGVASAVRLLALTIDPSTVVIGGGLSNLGDRLLAPVHEVLQGWETGVPFLGAIGLADRVRMLPPGLPAAAVGAALVGVA